MADILFGPAWFLIGEGRGFSSSLSRGGLTVVGESYSSVALSVERWSGSGSVLVSNGFLFNEGELDDTDEVQVFVNSVEQQIYIEALQGVWGDSSYRACLIQFNYNLTAGVPISGEIRFGGGISRGTSDIGKTNPPHEPAAMALPATPELVCARAGIFGPMIPDSVALKALPQGRTVNKPLRRNWYVETRTNSWIDLRNYFDWIDAAQTPARDGGGSSYDMVTMFWQDWARTGDTGSLRTSLDLLDQRYDDGNLYNQNVAYLGEQHANPWDAALGYYVTGSDDYWTLMAELADGQLYRANQNGLPSRLGSQGGNDRLWYTACMSCVLAYMLNCPTNALGYNRYLGASTVTQNMTDTLNLQDNAGKWGGSLYNQGQKTFMTGLLTWYIVNHYRFYAASTSIIAAIEDWMDFTWHDSWVTGAKGFKYVSEFVNTGNDDVENVYPVINSDCLPAWTWYYQLTGNQRVKEQCDLMMEGIVQESWEGWNNVWDGNQMYNVKQWYQANWFNAQVTAWRLARTTERDGAKLRVL